MKGRSKIDQGMALLVLRAALVGVLIVVLLQGAPPAGMGASFEVDDAHASRGADELGRSRIIRAFIGLADPARWSVDPATGLLFRRATQLELRRNGWDPGTFLVETGNLTKRARRGASELSVLIPLRAGGAQLVELDRLSQEIGPVAIETRVSGRGAHAKVRLHVTEPVFYNYHSHVVEGRAGLDINNALMLLVSSNEGGVSAYGVVDATEVHVLGPTPTWFIDSVPAPGPGSLQSKSLAKVSLLQLPGGVQAHWSACQLAVTCDLLCAYLGGGLPFDPELEDPPPPCSPFESGGSPAGLECVDGVDNDQDGTTDAADIDCAGHDHPEGTPFHFHKFESGRDFGLFGEVKACTYWGPNWKTTMKGFATSIINYFNEETKSLAADLRWGVMSCWVFQNLDDAQLCSQAGECPGFDQPPHVYPYAGDGSDADDYRSHVALDIQHAHAVGLNFPISVAHVTHKGALSDGDDSKCGKAFLGSGNSLSGYTVSGVEVAGCHNFRSAAHEIGHAFGADHLEEDADPCTFMCEGLPSQGWEEFFLPDEFFGNTNG